MSTPATSTKQNLLDLDREGLERFFADVLGEKRFRAHQVMKWIHHRHVTDFDEMTDLGKALRAKLHGHGEVRVWSLADVVGFLLPCQACDGHGHHDHR